MPEEIQLGQVYRDSITGFQGTATAVTIYLYGCRRVALERGDKDGKSETEYVDEQRLVHVESEMAVASPATAGGPHDAPPARAMPPERDPR
jgi:hypothetical protein